MVGTAAGAADDERQPEALRAEAGGEHHRVEVALMPRRRTPRNCPSDTRACTDARRRGVASACARRSATNTPSRGSSSRSAGGWRRAAPTQKLWRRGGASRRRRRRAWRPRMYRRTGSPSRAARGAARPRARTRRVPWSQRPTADHRASHALCDGRDDRAPSKRDDRRRRRAHALRAHRPRDVRGGGGRRHIVTGSQTRLSRCGAARGLSRTWCARSRRTRTPSGAGGAAERRALHQRLARRHREAVDFRRRARAHLRGGQSCQHRGAARRHAVCGRPWRRPQPR